MNKWARMLKSFQLLLYAFVWLYHSLKSQNKLSITRTTSMEKNEVKKKEEIERTKKTQEKEKKGRGPVYERKCNTLYYKLIYSFPHPLLVRNFWVADRLDLCTLSYLVT